LTQDELIKACINGDTIAQKNLYTGHSSRMLSIISRYVKDQQIAEDILVDGFVKVFANLNKFRAEGPFEGWLRRIFVNECLMYLRKNSKLVFEELTIQHETHEYIFPVDDPSPVLKLVDLLPLGCKTVFNLYVFEELTHKEIADELSISVSTSKSQYQLARSKLLELYKNYKISEYD
jgi:RNA polymerase sigma-70 factor (ECF subfamily)